MMQLMARTADRPILSVIPGGDQCYRARWFVSGHGPFLSTARFRCAARVSFSIHAGWGRINEDGLRQPP